MWSYREYLLSFRGLGLKSVECVRLLTLHHLAFPVSSNFNYVYAECNSTNLKLTILLVYLQKG